MQAKQLYTLTTMGQHQRRYTTDTNYWYCWTSADLQKD